MVHTAMYTTPLQAVWRYHGPYRVPVRSDGMAELIAENPPQHVPEPALEPNRRVVESSALIRSSAGS